MRSEREKLRLILEDMQSNIDYAVSKTADIDFVAFAADRDRLYIAVRCLEIISEASRRLGEDVKARHPNIPWRHVADAGNVYRHEYDALDAVLVWDTITLALQPLRQAIVTELENLAKE